MVATDWSEHRDPKTENVYFFNASTRASRWDCPLEYARLREAQRELEHPKELPVRDVWEEIRDEASQKPYYYNKLTLETSWEPPCVGAILKRDDEAIFDTSMGTMAAEIYLDRVPRTASNFIDLVDRGFYNGLSFHRVVPGFMNQFGCPHSKIPADARAGKGGPQDGEFLNLWTGETELRVRGGNILDEFVDKSSNMAGTLAMANTTGEPNTSGSQFFFNLADNVVLDWFSPGNAKHVVFGRLLDKQSFDVAIAMSKVKTLRDKPMTPIKMDLVTIHGAKRPANAAAAAADEPPAKARKT